MKASLWVLAATMVLAFCAGCVTEEQKHLTPTKHGERTTTYGKALDKAEDVPCDEYLTQLNQAVHMYAQDNEKLPPDLDTVIKQSGLPKSELQNCKYTYDPATGKVGLVR